MLFMQPYWSLWKKLRLALQEWSKNLKEKESLVNRKSIDLLLIWLKHYPAEYFLDFFLIVGFSSPFFNLIIVVKVLYVNTCQLPLEILYCHCIGQNWIHIPSKDVRDMNSVFIRSICLSAVIDGSEQQINKLGGKFREQTYYSGQWLI